MNFKFSMNDFDVWNEIKKGINDYSDKPDRFPKEGEVWMSAFGRNLGFEQNGAGDNFSRPVLIVKKFNNTMFWVVPLSTKQKKLDFYFNYTDLNNEKVSAILAQLKLVSVKRFTRKLHEMHHDLFLEAKKRLKSFL